MLVSYAGYASLFCAEAVAGNHIPVSCFDAFVQKVTRSLMHLQGGSSVLGDWTPQW